MSPLELLLLAWILEVAMGWPAAVSQRIGHPVEWIGKLIEALEPRLNLPEHSDRERRWAGVALSLTCIGLAASIAEMLETGLSGWIGQLIIVAMASSLLASRSLYEHVQDVAAPLLRGDLPAAREAVNAIVGRDCRSLDEAGVSGAALESLAENASDGVVAPLFWGVLFGLPGLAAYKAINTLDSMLGHRTDRLRHFGSFAARLDDVANFLPARLTGLLIALVSRRPGALRVMLRDAPLHRSPNAGWPEAAMAAALGVKLSGPRSYGGEATAEPWLNAAGREAVADDLQRGLAVYRRALALLAVMLIGALLMGLR